MNCLRKLSQEEIKLKLFLIITRKNYQNLSNIIDECEKYKIKNYELIIGNLNSYDYSEFTSSDNVYVSTDTHIMSELTKVKEYGEKRNINVSIPKPADSIDHMCNVFWTKFQTWPTRGCNHDKKHTNMVPMACKAVVKGDIKSLGYLLDYDSLMDAWNSEELVKIRRNLLSNIYPSEYCKECFCYHLDDGYYKTKAAHALGRK